MILEPLVSDCPAIVYIDFKSPYAYLAVEPTRELERELGVQFDWRPFVLDIPSYLGSARLDKTGKVVKQNRSNEQWSGVKYAYYDCRRYASQYEQTIRGTEKIWDTNLVATAMLWVKKYDHELQQQFIDLVYPPFWKRELDIENTTVIQHLLDQIGANGAAFSEWVSAEGEAINVNLQATAFSAGIFGVPTYVVGTELYFGREHLNRIRWQLTGQQGSAPDIGNPLPAILLEQPQPPAQMTIGIDDSLDSLLAIPQLFKLLSKFSGTVNWVKIETRKASKPPLHSDDSRSALHKQWREKNRLRNLERYDSTEIASFNYADTIDQLLQQNQISLKKDGPEKVIRPAMPGIVILLGEELFIGRQHLPLITARLNTRA
ncbi:MAG: 2-hydroxychromene-2-carboxylate isomerase [Flavobacterium sp.]|jgi:2-hydroxychromene-2-carboxylate isomerase